MVEPPREDGLGTTSPSLKSLGGEHGLWARMSQATDPETPSLIVIIAAEWDQLEDLQRAEQFAVRHLSNTPSPNALGESVDALLSAPLAAAAMGNVVAATLIGRAHHRGSGPSAELAARALEGAMRFVLAGWASEQRLPLLAELVRTEGASSAYTSRVARLLSVAYEQWQVPEAKSTLDAFLNIPGAEADVAYELGMVSLADGLAAASTDDVMSAMHLARSWLARAEAWDVDRTDAAFYAVAIDA